MTAVIFEIKSMLAVHLEMVEYPTLSSPKKWVQKAINLLKKHAPKVLDYLSRQHALAHLDQCDITINTRFKKKRKKPTPRTIEKQHKRVKRIFSLWIRKEKFKRLIFLVAEGLVIPFTPFLALLPGPNVFFYIPALLFYYHFTSYRGLRKAHSKRPDIDIHIQ